jgi:hypothetical protein
MCGWACTAGLESTGRRVGNMLAMIGAVEVRPIPACWKAMVAAQDVSTNNKLLVFAKNANVCYK